MQLMVVGDSSSVLGNCRSTVSSKSPLTLCGGDIVGSTMLSSLSPILYMNERQRDS